MSKTTAWFVVFSGCGCSDVQLDPDSLPQRCPGHDRERINTPEQIDCLDQYVGLHDCGRERCPAEAVAAS